MRVIIAEDEQRARRGLKSLLMSVSDEIDVVADAADGKSAMDLIKKLKPDVVFTDIKMPYLDGIELIKKIQELKLPVKFVITSAYEEFEYARQAIVLNVTDYLVKPIIMEDVVNIIEKLDQEMYCMDCTQIEKEKKCDHSMMHPLVRKAIQVIEKDYASKISQKELADKLGLSQEYFSSLFAKETGESFVKYLNNYRIEIARTLLKHGCHNKEEVAFNVGFSDIKYFQKVFKEICSQSVSEYCRECKEI